MKRILLGSLKGSSMKHLNDWDQHLMQWSSEAELENGFEELAQLSEHSGAVIKAPSLLEQIFGSRNGSVSADEISGVGGKAYTPGSKDQIH